MTKKKSNTIFAVAFLIIVFVLSISTYLIELFFKLILHVELSLDFFRNTLISINIIPPLLILFRWSKNNQLKKYGFLGAIYHWRMVYNLRKGLIQANYFYLANYWGIEIAILPNIYINFENEFNYGKLFIENSIRLEKRLSTVELSSELGKYAIEQHYLTDSQNHYVYEIYNTEIERQLHFDTLLSFEHHTQPLNKYQVFIDKKTVIRIHHFLIVGSTGTGKTYALYSLILQSLLKPIKYDLYFADPKNSSLAQLGEKINSGRTAYNIQDIIALIELVYQSMIKRQAILKKNLTKKLDADYTDFDMTPIILIFDEYASFKGVLNTLDKKTRDKVDSQLQSIVLMGRQLGCFLWIIMQKSDATTLPTQLRDNLVFKVVLGNAEATTYVTTFGASANSEVPEKKMVLGEGVYTYPQLANKPNLLAFPVLNFDINLAFDELLNKKT